MRVFITGGAGFIGSHLCDALIARGNEVSILDNLSTGTIKNIAHLQGKIEINQGDIRNKEEIEKLTRNADLVLHMAAAVGVNNILENPRESVSTNFHGSEVVLNAAVKFEKRIVIASTSEIYGKNPKQPLSEVDDRVIGTPQKLRWTYSDAKALEEAIAYSLFISKNLQVTTIRLFNTVGPRQIGDYGMVIPKFISAAINNEPIKIFGSGTQSRVFCHVLDAVEAIISLASTNETVGEVFNIGGEGEISILDLAKKIITQLNSISAIQFIDYKEAYSIGFEDMIRRVPDISKIKNFIKWSPKRDLTEVISDVANSLNQRNLSHP
jgi:UDP-glucose 4-epimerase